VDIVLSPVEIAVEPEALPSPLPGHRRHRTEGEPSSIADDELVPILAVLKKVTGTDFNHYKTPTIKRRLQRRMAVHRLASVEPYLALLKERPEEVRQLYQDILIHVTRFFREPESFDILRRVVFPEIEEPSRGRGFRI
jgi:two-component system CheB/CheR fusion protein